VIKKAYHRLARKFHPDKYVQTNPQECDSATKFVVDPTKQFTEITEANEVLSNPLQRRLYDLLIGVRDKTDSCETIEAAEMKKQQASQEVENMQCTHDIVKRREVAKKGVVIVSALYGDLSAGMVDSQSSSTQQDFGKTVDVKLPLQCLVEETHKEMPDGKRIAMSALVIAGGESKANLAGFYDPCLGEEKQLFVRYMYGNKKHEVTVADRELLKIPCHSHHSGNLVVFDRPEHDEVREARRERTRRKGGLPAGRFARERAAKRVARRRRSNVVGAGIFLLAGYAFHRRFPDALPSAWEWLQSSLNWEEEEEEEETAAAEGETAAAAAAASAAAAGAAGAAVSL
jgi:hypothetical protein